MYYLYYLISKRTYIFNGKRDTIYVGVSKNPKRRWNSHNYMARKGKNTPLYNCMREHEFFLITVKVFQDKTDAYLAEQRTIESLRKDSNTTILNVANGGLGGYVVPEEYKEIWRAKLIKAREGRKPALGMKHTEENKRFFAECNKRKIPKYPKDIITLSFREANGQYNISKTHYYRLLKQAKSNDLS